MFKIESYITPILLSYVDKYIKNFRPEDSQVQFAVSINITWIKCQNSYFQYCVAEPVSPTSPILRPGIGHNFEPVLSLPDPHHFTTQFLFGLSEWITSEYIKIMFVLHVFPIFEDMPTTPKAFRFHCPNIRLQSDLYQSFLSLF